jgi:hypothetical protein
LAGSGVCGDGGDDDVNDDDELDWTGLSSSVRAKVCRMDSLLGTSILIAY